MTTNWTTVKAKAQAVRQRYSISQPPVNLFEIAASEGIEILYFVPDDHTDHISGLLEKDQKKLFLNVKEPAARQNFTLAHELAHYFLNHDPNEYGIYRRDSLHATGKPAKELEADYFAAELLMPEELIHRAKTQYGLNGNDGPALAQLFGVSTEAMRYRLQTFTQGPSAE